MVQTAAWTTFRVPNWLLSDTEESVVGALWHQRSISTLADMLEDVSARRGAVWGVADQIALIGLQHDDGTDYDPRPDVMVLRQPLVGNPASVRLDRVGAPLFVAEVASDSTKLNDQGDKRQAYAAIGIPEYVVFDPDGSLLATPILAWRLENGSYVRWYAEADGWWYSSALDLSFRAAQSLLSVRDRDDVIIEPAGQLRRRMRQEEQRLRELADRLAVEEHTRHELADRLAVEEQGRNDAERQRDVLERRLQEEARLRAALEARLRRLQGGHDAPDADSR